MPHRFPSSSRRTAFTLVEVMIVVVIVGLLAAMGISAFERVRVASRAVVITNDLRHLRDAVEIHRSEHGAWPESSDASSPLAGLESSVRAFESGVTYGAWSWSAEAENTGTLTLTTHSEYEAIMARVDRQLDDGDLATGRLQGGGNEFTFTFE